ncbi:ankyrin repeat-containing protein NPR4-like [Corylus avellana]|uniref:ankyrin repeat-containing protein NPR4-like n=1 Tax=Corylus avellana TaxID=13451 RepID=UPI00286A04A1|nr:ankyrin repeat-containing protein NPR4-like [Corylus avellana]
MEDGASTEISPATGSSYISTPPKTSSSNISSVSSIEISPATGSSYSSTPPKTSSSNISSVSSTEISPATGSSYSSTLPPKTSSSNISCVSSTEISPASNNSAGTSKGKSPIPSEDLEVHQGAAPNHHSSMTSSEISPAGNNSAGTSQGKSPSQSEDLESETDAGEIILHEKRTTGAPLLRAAIRGDWPAAKTFLEENPEYVQAPITREKSTVLHIAAAAQHTTFIEGLLSLELGMTPEDVAIMQTSYGYTALHSAAQSGNVDIAEQLVRKNKELPFVRNEEEEMALHVAAYLGQTNLVSHLFSDSFFEKLTREERIKLFHYTICNDMYDIALKILGMDAELATTDYKGSPYGWKALEELAKKPFAIGSESRPSYWKSCLNSWFKGVYNKDLTKTRDNHHQLVDDLWKMVQIPRKQFLPNWDRYDVTLIFEAAKIGNVEFLIELANSYPDLLWQLDKTQMSIFHIAVSCCHESVFNLIYEIGGNKDSLASYANSITKDNMLHLAGQLAPLHRLNIVSGAALQMQRELLWFKGIEKIVPRSCLNGLNSQNKTPKQVFTMEHSDLRKDGEKWMRETSNYCMLVATLIATMIFAAAFTVPGGNDQTTGTPLFFRSNWLMVFFISDAIALCSSSTSIAIFLSILTSRYTEEEFLTSLPSKLMLGFATLFFSMVGMMVAFSATCFLVYTRVRAWASFAVVISVGIPIISFVGLHLRLFVDIFHSTYNSRFLFRPNECRLFQQKMQDKQKEKKIGRGSSDLEDGR